MQSVCCHIFEVFIKFIEQIIYLLISWISFWNFDYKGNSNVKNKDQVFFKKKLTYKGNEWNKSNSIKSKKMSEKAIVNIDILWKNALNICP